MSDKESRCALCGEPMPEGEQMFRYHGHSGPCPKPILTRPKPGTWDDCEQHALDFDAGAYTLEVTLDHRWRRIVGPTPSENFGVLFGPAGEWLTTDRAEGIVEAIVGWWKVCREKGASEKAADIRSAIGSTLPAAPVDRREGNE